MMLVEQRIEPADLPGPNQAHHQRLTTLEDLRSHPPACTTHNNRSPALSRNPRSEGPQPTLPNSLTTRYTYRDAEDRYVVSFVRRYDLSTLRMVDSIKGVTRIAANLVHFDGAYLRFVGDIEISRYRGQDLSRPTRTKRSGN